MKYLYKYRQSAVQKEGNGRVGARPRGMAREKAS